MLASEYLSIPMRLATVVVPVAVYFLLLGLLNSRRHPQLLTGRRDFVLLLVALSPTFVLPALDWVGATPLTVCLAVAAVGAVVLALAPSGHNWVIYNLPAAHGRRLIGEVLQAMRLGHSATPQGFSLARRQGAVEIGGFPLLRNVSVRLRSCDGRLAQEFQSRLARRLATEPAETTPTAAALLLVATAMLVLPMALMAERMPEMVRILTDLLP